MSAFYRLVPVAGCDGGPVSHIRSSPAESLPASRIDMDAAYRSKVRLNYRLVAGPAALATAFAVAAAVSFSTAVTFPVSFLLDFTRGD